MIDITIKELMAAKNVAWERRITFNEAVNAAGISQIPLSCMMNNRACSLITRHLDKLYQFFECEVHGLMKPEPDGQSSQQILAV